MEKNKSVQYTFGPEEKEILNSMSSFEGSLESGDDEKNSQIRYYNNFTFNGKTVEGLKNIFIVIEKDEKGEIIGYDLYTPDMKKILSADSEGKIIESIEDLEKTLGKIDVLEVIKENEVEVINEKGKKESKLKGISEKAEPEEMEKTIKGEEKDKEVEKEEQDEKQDEETKQVEKDFEEQGQDLRISKYRKVKDSHVAERMPDVFDNGAENGIAYSNKLQRFVMISKVDGQYQINENVEPAKMTWKTIISIGEDGKQIERKVPHALMKTNRDDKEIAVTIGQYGEVNIETVDVLPCQERIARGVREENEGLEKEETASIRREFQTEGKEYTHTLAHQVENIEDAQREANQVVDYQITEADYIPDTETTWGELMEETGESLPKLVERFNSDMAKSDGKEETKNIVQRIIDDYQMVAHEHTRGLPNA